MKTPFPGHRILGWQLLSCSPLRAVQFPGFHYFWWETSFFDLCIFWGQCIPLSRTSEEYLWSCELLICVYVSSVWDCFLTRICISFCLKTASAVPSSGIPLPAPLFSLGISVMGTHVRLSHHTSTTMLFEDSLVFCYKYTLYICTDTDWFKDSLFTVYHCTRM